MKPSYEHQLEIVRDAISSARSTQACDYDYWESAVTIRRTTLPLIVAALGLQPCFRLIDGKRSSLDEYGWFMSRVMDCCEEDGLNSAHVIPHSYKIEILPPRCGHQHDCCGCVFHKQYYIHHHGAYTTIVYSAQRNL